MKLIVIYGAPATGKYTVGTELSRLTGIPLLHNHLSIDLVRPFIEFGTDEFWRANGRIRRAIIAGAARSGSSLIKTFVYGKGDDDPYFEKIIAATEDNGGEVGLVLLLCDKEERRKRIGNESRVQLRKLTDPTSVDSSRFVMDEPYDGRETLTINTTDLPPAEAARKIIDHFDFEIIEKS